MYLCELCALFGGLPLLRMKHVEARLAFARGHLWSKIPAFGQPSCGHDETKLELLGHMDAEYVVWKKGEPYKLKNTVPNVNHGGGNNNAMGMLLFQWHN